MIKLLKKREFKEKISKIRLFKDKIFKDLALANKEVFYLEKLLDIAK